MRITGREGRRHRPSLSCPGLALWAGNDPVQALSATKQAAAARLMNGFLAMNGFFRHVPALSGVSQEIVSRSISEALLDVQHFQGVEHPYLTRTTAASYYDRSSLHLDTGQVR